MAITFDASTNGFANTTTSPQTWSHTNNGDIIIVGLVGVGGVSISSVTYAGAALTLGYSGNAGALYHGYFYYKVNPATGANNIVATFSGSLTWFMSAVSISLNGIHTSDPTDSGAGSSLGQTIATISNTVTTNTNGCWVLSLQEESVSRLSCGWTAGSGETLRGCNGAGCAMSSKPDNTPAGSVTMSETTASGNQKGLFLSSWRPNSFSATAVKDLIRSGIIPFPR